MKNAFAESRVCLFDEIVIRENRVRNRVWVPAMCQYVSEDGSPSDWHRIHYPTLSTAVGCVIVEATATSEEARVTPQDLVLCRAEQVPSYRLLAHSIAERGALPGIQLSHCGRKGSRTRPWEGDVPIANSDGGWSVYGPSAIPFAKGYPVPIEMGHVEMSDVIDQFVRSAQLASEAGFKLIELHAGHGRLLHSFLSPLANRRTDRYGGDLPGRARLLREVASAVRKAVDPAVILSIRLSCVDWSEGGLEIEDSVTVSSWLKADGADLINCSSGGIVKPQQKTTFPGYQVAFAEAIRGGAGIRTGAVGLVDSFEQVNDILAQGKSDVVLMGRHLLMDPFSLLRYAALNGRSDLLPKPYARAVRKPEGANAEFIPEL